MKATSSGAVILAPTDLSETSGDAIACAVNLARRLKCGLVLLRVLPEAMVEKRIDAGQFIDEQIETERAELERWFHAWIPAAEREFVSSEMRIAIGDPVKEILDQAEALHAELIVMATHGRTGLPRALFGSVAEGVLRHAACPVMTVRAQPQPVPV